MAVSKIEIPSRYGSIDEIFPGSSGKTVIFIQDAHDSLEAQENIAKIIEDAVERFGVKTVFEEGYEGPVPTDRYFGFIKDGEVKRKISYFFLDHLRLGGAEYAHINRRKNFRLIGADSIELHKENIAQYRLSVSKKEAVTNDLKALATELQSLARKRLPKELLEWLKLKDRFDAQEIDLLNYLDPVMKILAKKDALPRKPLTWIPFLLAIRDSKDAAALEKAKRLPAREIFTELSALESAMGDAFLTDPTDKKILSFSGTLKLLRRLSDLQLSREEFEALEAALKTFDTKALAQLIHGNTPKTLILSRQWEENVRAAIRFYEIAKLRDEAVERQLGEFMDNPDESLAVLVYGGFHRENIKRILKSKGIGYQIATPRISGGDMKHAAYYRQLMETGKHPFELPPNLRTAARAESRFEIWEANPALARLELSALISVARKMKSANPADFSFAAEQKLKILGAGENTLRSEIRHPAENSFGPDQETQLRIQLEQIARDPDSGLLAGQVDTILEEVRTGALRLRGENFDIIRPEGQTETVIGQIDRNIAHRYGLLHRVADVFIITPEGKILLHRRAHNIVEPLKLSIPGGHVKAGHGYRDSIKEEIVEELGLPEGWKVDEQRLLGVRREGGFRSPDWNDKDRETRSLYVYFASTDEMAHVRAMAAVLEQKRQELGETSYRLWLESEQREKSGYGEVWSVHEVDYAELNRIPREELSGDLLAPLLHASANQDVRQALRGFVDEGRKLRDDEVWRNFSAADFRRAGPMLEELNRYLSEKVASSFLPVLSAAYPDSPAGQRRVAYPGSGSDVIGFLYGTNAIDGFLISREKAEVTGHLVEVLEKEAKRFEDYLAGRKSAKNQTPLPYILSDTLGRFPNLFMLCMAELFALGVTDVRVRTRGERVIDFEFEWRHPNDPLPKKRNLRLIHSTDLAQPQAYRRFLPPALEGIYSSALRGAGPLETEFEDAFEGLLSDGAVIVTDQPGRWLASFSAPFRFFEPEEWRNWLARNRTETGDVFLGHGHPNFIRKSNSPGRPEALTVDQILDEIGEGAKHFVHRTLAGYFLRLASRDPSACEKIFERFERSFAFIRDPRHLRIEKRREGSALNNWMVFAALLSPELRGPTAERLRDYVRKAGSLSVLNGDGDDILWFQQIVAFYALAKIEQDAFADFAERDRLLGMAEHWEKILPREEPEHAYLLGLRSGLSLPLPRAESRQIPPSHAPLNGLESLRLKRDVMIVIEQAKIDGLSPEMFTELLELAGLNSTKLHLVIPDALAGSYSPRVAELKKIASVFDRAPKIGALDAAPAVGFSDARNDTLPAFQERLELRLAERLKDSVFTLERSGIFGVALLYALKDIPPDQLPQGPNGFRSDPSGRYCGQILEALGNYVVVSTSA